MLTLLIVLLVSFGLLSLISGQGSTIPLARRGQISLGNLFLLTGVSHFLFTRQIAQMVPPIIPAPDVVIYLTGLVELGLAQALIRGWRMPYTGWAVIVFLIAVFPANVHAAMAHLDFGGYDAGPGYLLMRAPFQVFLIAWAYFFCVRKNRVAGFPTA